VDQEVASDGNLITSRSPEDLPAFCAALIDALAVGNQQGDQWADQREKQSSSR
jgi:putative intracellular protease/amidase